MKRGRASTFRRIVWREICTPCRGTSLQGRFSGYLDRHANSEAARAIVAAEEEKISLYERHEAFVSYGYYIARKTGEGIVGLI